MQKYTNRKTKLPKPKGHMAENPFTIGREGPEFDAFKGSCPSRSTEKKSFMPGSPSGKGE